MLEVQDLFKQYVSTEGTPGGGVFGVNFQVKEGELFTLLGPSGCGKTTTLRSIAGLEKPQSGRIALAGTPLFDSARRTSIPMHNRDIGMVFQSYAIWPHMTVFQNAAYPLQVGKVNRKLNSAQIRKRVMDTLALVGLEDYASRPAPQLSGGQQQRLALARALTRSPSLLLLDEPLSNLDAQLREQMRVELKRLQRETGVTAIYVTHDQAEALAISDRIAVMRNGVIMQLGTPREIYNRPTSEFVAEFIGRTNLFRGSLARNVSKGEEEVIESVLGPLRCSFTADVAKGPRVGVVIRPEDIFIAPANSPEAAQLPDINRFEGTIISESYLGDIAEFTTKVQGYDIVVRTRADTSMAPGSATVVSFPVSHTLALIEDGPASPVDATDSPPVETRAAQ